MTEGKWIVESREGREVWLSLLGMSIVSGIIQSITGQAAFIDAIVLVAAAFLFLTAAFIVVRLHRR